MLDPARCAVYDPSGSILPSERMLSYLKVRNLAIVEEFSIEPGRGLNVLTGETGAGKSLLIDSLEFLSGARGSTDSIRSGEDRMVGEALFHVARATAAVLDDIGLDVQSNGDTAEVIVRRELASGGRGRVFLNGSPVTVRDLVRAMDPIVEIHGQSESHDRIAGQSFREVVDTFAAITPEVRKLAGLYRAWSESAEQLETLAASDRDRALRIDTLRFQVGEIEKAAVRAEEETELREERAILSNAREIIEAASGAFALLDDADDSAGSQIVRSAQLLHAVARQVSQVGELTTQLEDIRYRLQDVAHALGDIAESTRHDPDRLEQIEERLALLDRLKRKYGGTVDEILVFFESASRELANLQDYEGSIAKLQAAEKRAFDEYAALAGELSTKRRAAAREFEAAVQNELRDLAMEGTTLRVNVTTAASAASRLQVSGAGVAFGVDGYDRIEFLISPNRGEELRPMQRVASGGELSRIQLAIAAALFKSRDIGSDATLVFDEIDSGIGGRVAEVVGRKLRELARTNQVICVTHLPQIASLGETHFRVWKEESEGRTRARIERLDDRTARTTEIARMLGGETITESARRHAVELLDAGDAVSKRKPVRARS